MQCDVATGGGRYLHPSHSQTLHLIWHRRGGGVLMISLATCELAHEMVVVYAAVEDCQ
jgi:hypothetical protein